MLPRISSAQQRRVSCQAEQWPRTALVTGANTGMGFVTARTLASQGCYTVLACRDLQKANEAKARIKQEFPNAKVETQRIDLADLSSIRAFTDRATQMEGHTLDLLINNAGVMATPELRTVDGFELQLGVNHLGHMLLTESLMPLLTNPSRPSRIINVSSSAHMFGTINFDDLQSRRGYDPWRAYGQSKLANVLYTYELARRLTPQQNCTANTLHPGVVATELGRYLLPGDPQWWQRPFIAGLRKFLKTPEQGASTQLYLATSPEVAGVSGKYFVDSKPKTSNKESYDPEVARRLWEVSAELINLKPAPVAV